MYNVSDVKSMIQRMQFKLMDRDFIRVLNRNYRYILKYWNGI